MKTKTETKEERGRRSQNSTLDGALVRPSSAQIQQRGANLMAQAPSPQQGTWLQRPWPEAPRATESRCRSTACLYKPPSGNKQCNNIK